MCNILCKNVNALYNTLCKFLEEFIKFKSYLKIICRNVDSYKDFSCIYYEMISRRHRSEGPSDRNKEIRKRCTTSISDSATREETVADVIGYRCVPNNPITSEMLPRYK